MIKYSRNLYLTKQTEKKIDKIKWKLAAGAGMVGLQIITLAENETDLFDIYPVALFKQRYFRKRDYMIIGVAENKKAAVRLVERIITDCAKRSGTYENIRSAVLRNESDNSME